MKKFNIQENYPEQYCHCYGCGKKNKEGLGIKSYWDGEKAVALFTPSDKHIAVPGYVYGGLIASLVDCHGIGTASAAIAQENLADSEDTELRRYVTASLHVDFLKPTPLGVELKIVGMPVKIHKRKIVVKVEVYSDEVLTAKGEVIAVPMPKNMA